MNECKIRVLVVDDSAFMRHVLRRMLERDSGIEIVGYAKNGEECIALTDRLKPDVVTLDVEMRGMGGLEALRAIATGKRNAPAVIMVSALTTQGARTTLEALELGAVDFIAKPAFDVPASEILGLGDEVVAKVRACGEARASAQPSVPPSAMRPARHKPKRRIECIGIGTSTGGPVALGRVLPELPRDFPAPIVIAQHMPPGFTSALAERLDAMSAIEVREARNGMPLQAGQALVAPAGNDARVRREGITLRVDLEPVAPPQLTPRVDVLFGSLAKVYGTGAAAVILTGMGHDGVDGMRALHDAGGFTIGQDEASCVVFGMPRAAAEAGLLDRVVALDELPRLLCEVTGLGVPLQRQEGSRPFPPGT